MGVAGWSGEAWAGIITATVAAAGAIGAGVKWLVSDRTHKAYERGWDRVTELDEEVKLLRIALHKATQRGNTGWTVSEILSLAMPLELEDRLRAVRHAREIAERSLTGSAR